MRLTYHPSRITHPASLGAMFAALTLLFYWEILFPWRILADYDVWVYFYPLRAYAAQALQMGRFPLWNPDTFLGAPFFANAQTSLLYPGTLLFYVLPVGYAYSLSVLIHVFLAAILTYAFLRHSFQVGRIAALLGASAFAFGGLISAQVGHINQLSASAWLPGVALCADLAARRRSLRWTAAGAGALAVQLLAGHAQQSYITLWVVAIVLLWRGSIGDRGQGTGDRPGDRGQGTGDRGTGVSADPRPPTPDPQPGPRPLSPNPRRVVGGLGLAVAIGGAMSLLGFGLAAIQLLPAAELSAHSIRSGGMSYLEATAFSLAPTMLLQSLLPGYWQNPFAEYIGYIGAVGLGFAIVALVFGRPAPTGCAAALAALGLFLAAGAANPFYGFLLEVVPGLDLFRVPARWLLMYSFGVAALASLGVDWVLARGQGTGDRGQGTGDRGQGTGDRGRGTGNREPLAPSPRPPAPNRWRLVAVGLLLVALAAVAISFAPSIPRRMLALWVVGLAAAPLLSVLAVRWPHPVVAAAIIGLSVGELRLAVMDFPQRHPVPSQAADGTRPVSAYLKGLQGPGRILSIAPTEYELGDHADLAAQYPDLGPQASFAFKTALKLEEVMSPNVPLRHGLSTPDGYDGGLLPLRRYLQLASLLVPADEVRPDGVLRTRLIAVPEERLLRLLNIRAVIAGRLPDVELDRVHFDVATARMLRDGDTLRLDLPRPVRAEAIALLGSVASTSPAPSEGRMTVWRADGSQEETPLRVGERVFLEMGPGPVSAPQPTAGLSRGGRADSAVLIPLPRGAPVTAIQWRWRGPNPWALRAATILIEDGSQEQIVLEPSLRRMGFADLKIYEYPPPSPLIRLVPTGEVRDDAAALAFLRSSSTAALEEVVILAPDPGRGDSGQGTGDRGGAATVNSRPPAPDPQPPSPGPRSGPRPVFRRLAGPPERLVYQRAQGDGGGYLVIDDAWFPGWRAEIDGQEVPVYRANIHFKAVHVPPSAQMVVLSYEPDSVKLGAAISLLSFLMAVALLALGRAR